MNPFLYDLLRGFRSRGVLILIALTTLLALTVLVLGLHALATNTQGIVFTPAQLSAFVVNAMGAIYGFFVPVLGIVAAYETYGRDRVTGILESVLCRPVTRTEVILARFLALVLASALAVGLALGVIDLVLYSQTGDSLPAVSIGALFLALLVEAAAFGGMVFLFSHLFRSTGALQGFSTMTFVFFSIIWYILIIVTLISTGLNSPTSATHTITEMVFADYFNPAQYALLVTAFLGNSFFFGLIAEAPSAVGLTIPGIVASGAFWSVVPFLGACYLARKRD